MTEEKNNGKPKARSKKRQKGEMPRKYRNRITHYSEEDPEQLLANPLNWRLHPKHQQDALEGVLEEVGWVQNVIVNDRTGHMIDGHLRTELAIKHGEPTVSVTHIDVDENEERLLLATLDPVATLAAADPDKLEALIRETKTDSDSVQSLIQQTAEAAGLVLSNAEKPPPEEFEEIDEELPGAQALKPDMLFKSKAPYGIPELKPDMIPELPDNLMTWPGLDLIERGIYEVEEDTTFFWNVGSTMKGLPLEQTIMGFYAEDYKFEPFWDLPDVWAARIINGGFRAAVVPNYSVWWEQPEAYHIYQYYRAAWTGRYMQECGIKVIPDFKVGLGDPQKDAERMWFAGVPHQPNSLALQMQPIGKEDVHHHVKVQRAFAYALEYLEPKKVLVYASRLGERLLQEACPTEYNDRVIWIPTTMDMRRDHIQWNKGKGSGRRF